MSSLVSTVADDVRAFVGQQQELMFNEGDFQLQLAVYLRLSGHYDDVQVEYYIPNSLAGEAGYDWDSNLYIDIVVRRGDDFVPVELKYPTRRVVRTVTRFGRLLPDVVLMRNQGAQDIVSYNFWKDVRRCEIIRKLFPAAKGALAVMLTNDPYYVRPMRPTSAGHPFTTEEGATAGAGTMDWQGSPAIRRNHMPFNLDSRYTIRWTNHAIDGETFYLTIVTI